MLTSDRGNRLGCRHYADALSASSLEGFSSDALELATELDAAHAPLSAAGACALVR
jgi:hypothetical protein